jgi:hypothetical protein
VKRLISQELTLSFVPDSEQRLWRTLARTRHHRTQSSVGAIAHRICQLIWLILHKGVRYEERGPVVCEKSKRARTRRMIRTLRNLGYQVERFRIPT